MKLRAQTKLKADDSGKLAYHRLDYFQQISVMTGTRQKINTHSRSVLIQFFQAEDVRVFFFFLFCFSVQTRYKTSVQLQKLIRLTFEFFFVEFPSVADGKTERTFLLNRSLICRQRSKVNRKGTEIFIQDFKIRTLHRFFSI